MAQQALSLDAECAVCKLGVEYIQALVGNDTAVIEATVHAKCMAMFGAWSPLVCEMVDREAAQLIKYVERDDLPLAACTADGLCRPAATTK